ncbi:MAG: penicillin-binding transpeptidase domain-containing protein [Bacteroidia bacterium]
MDVKRDILKRVYLMYGFFLLFGIVILVQVFRIQIVQGQDWIAMAESQTLAYKNIDALRGNIFADDGSLLATSLPTYEIRMDLKAEALTDEVFKKGIDSLSLALSELFKDKSAREYKLELERARKAGERYHLIKRRVTYLELKKLREFPIFRKGRYKGGFLYVQKNERARPFKILAARTIGYDREGQNPVGLEGAYDKELRGTSGKRLMQKIAGGVWMPVNDENEIEPENGADLYTSIDINIQDVAEHALMKQLIKHNSDHGCVVLMEVETGLVKAIANLSRNSDGSYSENYNYAIGESTEPGSTFKLVSLVAAMEDGYLDLDDSVDTQGGQVQFYDRVMKDSHEGGYGKISVQRVFEVSSNVGTSKLIQKFYGKNPQQFIDRVHKFNIHKPLDLEISGEGAPRIKNPKDKDWYGTTLPWMSIGYESRLTPLQILTFYNAIANNGKMVKPVFVKEIRKHGRLVKKMPVQVISESICSKETVKKAQKMLEGVVENGTASNLKNATYKIAGKTGTAQIANDKYGYKYESKVSYQASFCGYFPADNPKYSCIVVVNAPSNNVYYGNLVAGPIFKEIADKVYATNLKIHPPLSVEKQLATMPVSKNGSKEDLRKVLDKLNVKAHGKANENWVKTNAKENVIEIQNLTITSGITPNVVGMSLKDAVYILENKGFLVKVIGKGMIKNQSIPPGQPVQKGNIITLELA